MLDVFNSDAFTLTSMTAAINNQPFTPGFLGRSGLFEERGVNTLSVNIEEKNGVLTLLQTKPRGGPREGRERQRRKLRPFAIPHIPAYEYILADEVQGVREFGTEDQLETIESVRDGRLATLSNDMDATLEFHRTGAVKGIIYDADGETVLYNLFDEFEIDQPAEVDFDLDNANPASGVLRKKIGQTLRTGAQALGNLTPTSWMAICSDTFFDDLIAHPEVRGTYQYQQGAAQREGYVWTQVNYGGVTWVNLRNAATYSVATADKCHLFPIGIPGLFITRFGPANYLETVNTVGLPRYAKAAPDKFNTQLEIEAQMNPLNLCTRPGCLIQGKRT